ncbi:MAG: RNA polymerase factor sigma-54 [Deltaproteobacteria bacterium]|nr:RNA polymerase factor sigma-54 [Deltaproteobacteria bacterium]
MALELKQNLKLTQQLVMTPQLQQAIKMLQLSRIELIEMINQELENNPVLDETTQMEGAGDRDATAEIVPALSATDLEKTAWEKKALEEVEWKDYWDEDRKNAIQSFSFEDKEAPDYENLLTKTTDLTEHLMWQLQLSDATEQQRRIGGFIIGNLTDDGYLALSVEDIAAELECDVKDVQTTMELVQGFDPVGVAARDLKEALLLQAKHYGIEDPLVKEIITDHMSSLERHNYQLIAKATGRSVDDVKHAVDIITHFEPRPGRQYAASSVNYIVPDIYIYKIGDEYVITLNDDGMPNLKINPFYQDNLMKTVNDKQAKEFIQDKMKSALWLIKSIDQRKRTIYKVAESIVKFQKDFFDKGIEYLKPMVLRDVADDIEMHESTISRVTANKYMQTPHGLLELKYFFSAGLKRSDDADDIAAQSVKEKLRQLIAAEDPRKPYSDQKLVELLEKNNIKIARRTVAKYREMLGILPSSMRKRN